MRCLDLGTKTFYTASYDYYSARGTRGDAEEFANEVSAEALGLVTSHGHNGPKGTNQNAIRTTTGHQHRKMAASSMKYCPSWVSPPTI